MTNKALLFAVRQATLPITSSSKLFPIHRIYCIGRNYREHAVEMGHNPGNSGVEPFHFQKPADAVTTLPLVPYPTQTCNLHYEAELVVAIGKHGHNLQTLEQAEDLIFGYALGCDLTRRDLQNNAKKLSRPWDAAKGFDYSAPMTSIVPKGDIVGATGGTDAFLKTEMKLWVNEELKQSSTLDQMIWTVPEIIQYLSRYFILLPGDLVMTGTPAGVGPLCVGDHVRIQCGDQLPECRFEIVASN
jgi:fumarylpyruvate hydrolase